MNSVVSPMLLLVCSLCIAVAIEGTSSRDLCIPSFMDNFRLTTTFPSVWSTQYTCICVQLVINRCHELESCHYLPLSELCTAHCRRAVKQWHTSHPLFRSRRWHILFLQRGLPPHNQHDAKLAVSEARPGYRHQDRSLRGIRHPRTDCYLLF